MLKILIILFLISFINARGNGIREISEKFIIESCGADTRCDFKKFKIAPEFKNKIENECSQKFFRDEVIYWEIETADELSYIAIIDNVYGKTLPITFLVIFNLDGSIYKSTIIKYREEHGGDVSSKRWLAQFDGKTESSSFEVGEDIQAISGATISINSVSRGIKKLTMIFSGILKQDEFTAK
jgi:Na+-translocating ferredoxin:NAD+ oxidoreductase RnfG subunit